MADRLLTDSEVAAITGRARSTLQKDRTEGKGIPFVRFGRLVRYRESVVQKHIVELPSHRSTSEADAPRPQPKRRSTSAPGAPEAA